MTNEQHAQTLERIMAWRNDKDIIAALCAGAAALRAPVSAWQPMETAPKDGGMILGVNADGHVDQFWWQRNGAMVGREGWRNVRGSYYDLTHWQPLPSPPETPEAVRRGDREREMQALLQTVRAERDHEWERAEQAERAVNAWMDRVEELDAQLQRLTEGKP